MSALKVITGFLVGADPTKLKDTQLHVCLSDVFVALDLNFRSKAMALAENDPENKDKKAWGLVGSHHGGLGYDFSNLGAACKHVQQYLTSLKSGGSLEENLLLAAEIEHFMFSVRGALDSATIIFTRLIELNPTGEKRLWRIDSFNDLLTRLETLQQEGKCAEVTKSFFPLLNHKGWFTELRDVRDRITHNAGQPIVFNDKGEIYFGVFLGQRSLPVTGARQMGDKNIYPVRETLRFFKDKTIEAFNDMGKLLVVLYEPAFKGKVPCRSAFESLLMPYIHGI